MMSHQGTRPGSHLSSLVSSSCLWFHSRCHHVAALLRIAPHFPIHLLQVLTLQRLDLTQQPIGDEGISVHAKRVLPELSPLVKNLRALSLSSNCFTRLPECLSKLTNLEILDLNSE